MAGTQSTFDPKQPRFGQNQYLRDFAYATKHLKAGETEEDITKSIANFRRDLKPTAAVEYAQKTVQKAVDRIEHERALAESAQNISTQHDQFLPELDKHLEELETAEFARQLYASGLDTNTIELLEQHRGLSTEEAVDVANKAAAQVHAERDVEYAVGQLRREKDPAEIAKAVAQYRSVAVKDPEQYAKAIVETAQQVLDVEKDIPTRTISDGQIAAATQKFKRDVHFAYNKLENGQGEQQVLLDIQSRNPVSAVNNFNYQMFGQTDHSYTLAVLGQAQALQGMMKQGDFDLNSGLKVVQTDFKKDLSTAVQNRRYGKARADVANNISEGEATKQPYAQALVNNADLIVNYERSISVRPELARELTQHFKQQETVEKDKFHTPRPESERTTGPKNDTDRLASQRKTLNIPEDAKIITPNEADGQYYGKVLGQNADKVIQQTGPKTVVAHSTLDVGDKLETGKTYQVKYAQGKVNIKPYGRDEQDKKTSKDR